MPPLRRLSSIAYARPFARGIPHDHEVDREPPEHALRREALADRHRRVADQARVRRVGGEGAAEVALAAGAAEELIVGGQELDGAVGQRPQLHARAQELLADDALLHDAAVGLELGHVRRRTARPAPPAACPGRARRSPRRRSDSGSSAIPSSSTSALPAPETPSLSFTMTWRMVGRVASRSADRVDDLVEAVQVLGAERVRHADLAEEPPAAGLGAERGQARVGRRTSGCRGSGRCPARARSCCRG